MNDGMPGIGRRRWIALVTVVAVMGLGMLATTAIAQDATVTGEVTTTQVESVEAVPAGGTAAGDGGIAEDGQSLLPILLGVAGLGMALVAAGVARQRRFD